MRTALRLTTYLALVVAAGCSARASESAVAEFTPADSAAIRASGDKWVSTSLSRDFAAWGTTVTSDVVMYPPNSKPVLGRDAAVAFVTAFPTIEQFNINVDEVTGIGDVAYDRGTFTMQAKLPNGMVVHDTGSFFSVFRRQPDNSWQHSRVMWTTHAPMPAPPPPPARRAR
jgi:ketosteroid isomerase-like protein